MTLSVLPVSMTQVDWSLLLGNVERFTGKRLPTTWGRGEFLALPQALNTFSGPGDWAYDFFDVMFLVYSEEPLDLRLVKLNQTFIGDLLLLKGSLLDWKMATLAHCRKDTPESMLRVFNAVYLTFESAKAWKLFKDYRKIDLGNGTFYLEG